MCQLESLGKHPKWSRTEDRLASQQNHHVICSNKNVTKNRQKLSLPPATARLNTAKTRAHQRWIRPQRSKHAQGLCLTNGHQMKSWCLPYVKPGPNRAMTITSGSERQSELKAETDVYNQLPAHWIKKKKTTEAGHGTHTPVLHQPQPALLPCKSG